MKDLEKALMEGIAALKPVPGEAVDAVIESMREMITFERDEKDDTRWKELLRQYLPTADTFEIHCWSDEGQWIELALRYGREKPGEWQHGAVIEGPVTDAFRAMLLGLPKPKDTELYNKMTPFFNVFLNNGFSSSHYGTEVYAAQEEEK